jgi:ParB family chromosome partitioning protein
LSVLSGELDKKPKSKTPKAHKINHNIYSKYFNASVNQNEFEEIIDKALEEYFAKRQ